MQPHSGQWKDRHRMAWATWWLGAFLCIAGSIGLLWGSDTGSMIATGASMITLVVGIMVTGKVMHDKSRKDNPDGY